jgi:hypothetical protein
MNRNIILAVALLVCILPEIYAQTGSAASANKEGAPTITVTMLDINDKTLNLSWEIKNDSAQDAWILMGLRKSDASCSAFMDKDDQTLLIRRRLDVPANAKLASFPTCNGRYVRVRAGQTLSESVSLEIPVYREYGLEIVPRKAQGLEYAKRLTIEIGYYNGDLADMIHRILEKDEKNPRIIPAADPYYTNSISGWFKGFIGFNNLNELVRSRDDEILIPYTSQAFTSEQILRVTKDNMHIPYYQKRLVQPKRYPPDLKLCTRVEIQYQPSMLDYFFPYSGQQGLISSEEKEHLQAIETIVVENKDNLKTLVEDINQGRGASGIVRQHTMAQVIGYHNNKHLMSFSIYNDNSVIIDGMYRFEWPNGLQSLRMLTTHIHPIDLRVQCAANLKNLWHRFYLYEKASKSLFRGRTIKKPYPAPKTWCDSMLRAYRVSKGSDENLMKLYQCPSSGHDKCHYAMNPNCRIDSPPDMVLLFETKAGWNQHGGPELFTFDNHEPKGGCVLLNDGTVKFIRTKEELRQLRWE